MTLIARYLKDINAGRVVTSSRRLSSNPLPAVYSEHKDGITTIILNRSHRKNAIDRQTADLLTAAIRDFEADSRAKVGVLWGA
ncbi:hypothetical protein EON65_50645, partial [archaeon]